MPPHDLLDVEKLAATATKSREALKLMDDGAEYDNALKPSAKVAPVCIYDPMGEPVMYTMLRPDAVDKNSWYVRWHHRGPCGTFVQSYPGAAHKINRKELKRYPAIVPPHDLPDVEAPSSSERLPVATATAAVAETVTGVSAAPPRGHGLVGARIRWTHKADTIVARCDHYDAVGERYELVDDAGRRHVSLRLHGTGSIRFDVLAPPPSFGVHALECGLCSDVPTRATDCCRKLLCGECLRSIELNRGRVPPLHCAGASTQSVHLPLLPLGWHAAVGSDEPPWAAATRSTDAASARPGGRAGRGGRRFRP